MAKDSVQAEIEATFIEVEVEKLRQQLVDLGAKLLQKETLMQRTVFDIGKDEFYADFGFSN